jgi:glycerol-3-phosphate acyltransferase PlsX
MKREFKRNLWTYFCALVSGGVIKKIRKGMDYEGVGGAMFLGLNKAVVKGHGNSKARSFSACIAQAANAVRGDMTGKIKSMIDEVDLEAIQAQAQEAAAGHAE